ncbi:Protein DMP [Sesbania bispinosa]|nr:Protein DMP [Sesbania bispinosa]
MEMNNSTNQDVVVHYEESEDYYYDLDDYDMDESHYFSVINAILSGTARLNVLLPTVTTLAFTIFAPILTNDVSCVFFTFTDSFRTSTGRLYYGVATFRGIWTFCGGRKKPCLHFDVVKCYYPGLPRKVTNTVPLVVGFVVSIFFIVFPSKRRGIGYPFLLQHDPIYSRH